MNIVTESDSTASVAADAVRWAAVCERDVAWDGRFIFAVVTTGVYCRPNCAARRPSRANVRFFEAPEAARAAGFRACKRCRPDGSAPAADIVALVDRACRTIEAAPAAPTLRELAAAAGRSPWYFARVFTRIVGISPREYARAIRDARFGTELPRAGRVIDAMYEAGFGSSSRAYTVAPAVLGMRPGAARERGRGERVRFALAPTALGWIGVALTARGVAAIELGDDADGVGARIAERFAQADLARDDDELRAVVEAVVRYIERPAGGLSLPLDVAGTAFRHRVWRALGEIAPGTTATYAQIAAAIGRPGAARAVATACAANPVALAIPCHRVVPARGGPGGYRWGSARKRALLAAESSGPD